MGQYAYKAETLAPVQEALMDQFLADLHHVQEPVLMRLANLTAGGWRHSKIFLKNARRIFAARKEHLQSDLLLVGPSIPWNRTLLALGRKGLLDKADRIAEVIGGRRAALLCLMHNGQARSKEEALPGDLPVKLASLGKTQTGKPDKEALAGLTTEEGDHEGDGSGPDAPQGDVGKVRKLMQSLERMAGARENEMRALRRQHENQMRKANQELAELKAQAEEASRAASEQKDAAKADSDSLKAKLDKAEQVAKSLQMDLQQARQHVSQKARELAEQMLSEEVRPWLADARHLQAASDEVGKLRQLTNDAVEKVRRAQRDSDPFLAKEHELRQAIPQMEEMLRLLRRYQRTAGEPLKELVELEKRITDHIEKVRYELERRDHPTDPFLERISAKINAADEPGLREIEAALALAERSGLVDSRHADLYRRDLHRRRSYLGDRNFHQNKQAGPVALLERALAIGEPARLAIDANNFACLRQDFLGLKLQPRRNAQGESRFMLDSTARLRVAQLMEKLADDSPGLLVWVSFDGSPSALRLANPRVKVTFSRAGDKADHDIMDVVAKDKSNDGPWFVVSDDAGVRDAVMREGAYVIYTDALVRLLVTRGIRP
ncbi:MAG: hypothetical protein ACO3ND_00755 [Opitutales bacterium]